jgi:hypothetical protein
MSASSKIIRSVCVVSDGSEKLQADMPAGCIDSLFIRSPQSGMVEEQALAASAVTVSKGSGAAFGERRAV